MRTVLLALFLIAATFSAGCLSDNQDSVSSNNLPGCYEGQPDEEPQDCKADFPDSNNTTTNDGNTTNGNGTNSGGNDTNNTSNGTNSTDNANQTQEPEEPNYGPLEGYQIYQFAANARTMGGVWQAWQLYDHLNTSWNATPAGEMNGNDSRWILIQFLSTDCIHCWNAADDMSNYHDNYSEWVDFISFAVNFSSNNYFNASLDEIAAFQDKTGHSGCRGNEHNCSARPGDAHDWLYVDDRNQSSMYAMQAQSTPMYAIIMPNGTIAWNQNQHNGNSHALESIVDALQRFFGPMQ